MLKTKLFLTFFALTLCACASSVAQKTAAAFAAPTESARSGAAHAQADTPENRTGGSNRSLSAKPDAEDLSGYKVVLSSRPFQPAPHPAATGEKTPPPAEESASRPDNVEAALTSARKAAAAPVFPPDSKVFDEEDLIDVKGRLLSPYSYLTADPSAKTGAPWDGEQLKYGVYYSFIKAGTAYIKNRGIVDIDGRPAYLIQTTAFSATVIDAFFKVRDINQSWIDAQSYYSRGYTQSVREGSYKRDEWVTFDPANHTFFGQIQKKEGPRPIKGRLETDVADMLSSLYYVRAQKLLPGTSIVFDIVNREKQYPLIVNVLNKETVKTPAGKFNCIVVEPQIRGEGIFVSKGKSLKVWLTDDEYKMPVKMKTEVFIGSVSAELLEYKRN